MCFSLVWHQSHRRPAIGSSREEGAPGPEARVDSVEAGWVNLKWLACREGMVVWYGMRRSWHSCADALVGDEGVVKVMVLEEAEEKAFVEEERDSECWNPWQRTSERR
jgi:hypothetical protein